MNENELSRIIYESAIEVHRTLGGPGLLEKVYEEALVWELQQARVKVNRQVALPIIYKNNLINLVGNKNTLPTLQFPKVI